MLKIITDSSSNITPQEARELGVEIIPLTVSFGNNEFKDGVELDAERFYQMLANEKEFPHTSQINTDTFEEIFLASKANKDSLLFVSISSALSGTYSAAVRAKENVGYDGVYIYDSLATTVMLKTLVLEAVKNSDKSAEEIIKILDDLRPRIELYAIVDTLEYLHKGGRLKRGAAMFGTLFNVKPIVAISKGGTVDVAGKAVGTRSAIKTIAKKVCAEDIDENYPVFYVYSGDKEKCSKLIDAITPKSDGFLEDATVICPVIGAHVGPNAAGICFIRK